MLPNNLAYTIIPIIFANVIQRSENYTNEHRNYIELFYKECRLYTIRHENFFYILIKVLIPNCQTPK